MVVRLRTGKAIRGALSYNERKVAKGHADLILASGFSCDIKRLNFTEKLRRFESLTERNEWVKTNTLHLSLNFSPKEELSTEKMQLIAIDYLNRIGFGEQPFLVYKHKDANHPHLHIVTTNVQANGRRISMHNLGKLKSEPARKAIEEQFNLVRAETGKKQQVPPPTALDLLPAKYGKEETKHAITNILGEVLRTYKFGNLTELNIILRQRNIVADRGAINSRMYSKGGLVYSLLDENGYRTGVPIKASDIYGGPILKTLEQKFPANVLRKMITAKFARSAVFYNLSHSNTMREFSEKLRTRNISLHFDRGLAGTIQTVYFIDNRNKAVYTNEELGVPIMDVLRLQGPGQTTTPKLPPAAQQNKKRQKKNLRSSHPFGHFGTFSTQGVIDILLRPERGGGGSSGGSPKKKKQRKRPRL
jgi:hypothetical protein